MTMLPVREVNVGPEERSMRQRAVEARRRLFNGPAPTTKAIIQVKPESPFDPRRVEREIDDAIAAAVAEHPEPPMPPWKLVLSQVASKYGIPVSMLVGTCRVRTVMPARHEAAYRMVHELGMSLLATGRRLNRDHTTVLNSIKRHILANPELAFEIKVKKADEKTARLSLDDEILRLYFAEGRSAKSIADAMDVSRPYVHALVHREIVRVREAREAA